MTETIRPSRTDHKQQLDQTAAALQVGDLARARALLVPVLRADPTCAAAWRLAVRASEHPAHRVTCLRRYLALVPEDAAARAQLAKLDATATAQPVLAPSQPQPPTVSLPATVAPAPEPLPASASSASARRDARSGGERVRLVDLIAAPFAMLLSTPPSVVFGGLIVAAVILGLLYYRGNTGFFGLADPDFDSFLISGDYEEVETARGRYAVVYELPRDSTFRGLIRHVSTIREPRFPMLTHDILVTSGDFSDPGLVNTRVVNHHFTWRAKTPGRPAGTINLLHTVPADEAIYRELLALRSGVTVVVTGREILRINHYDAEGRARGDWHDTGCNTLLVTGVEILP